MSRRLRPVLWLATLFVIAAARGDETRLTGEATLRAAPESGAVLGLLTADAPVTEIAREGDWVRVRVEGWVRGASVNKTASPATGAPSAAIPAAGSAVSTATLEGTLQIKTGGGLRKKKLLGSGQSVWLLPAALDLEGVGALSAEDRALVAELDAQAAKLGREAERAMHGSNFTEATSRNEALLKERREVLERRAAILAASHRQREAAARQAALATAIVDSRGYFAFPPVAPGGYRLYARLATERELDLEWIETVEIGATGTKIDLDETRAQGLPEAP